MSEERSDDDILMQLNDAIISGEIAMNPIYMEKLLQLKNFDIVVICDDSGSMSYPSDYQPIPGLEQSRFDELENTIKKIAMIGNVIDNNGIDLIFLNNGIHKNVRDDASVSRIFNQVRFGGTPLCTAYRKFIKMYYPNTYDKARNQGIIPTTNITKSLGLRKQTVHAGVDSTKPILLIIATDGEPSDGSPAYLRKLMEDLNPPTLYRSILACTGDESVLSFLKSMDTLDRTDVTDDFNSEKTTIDIIQKHYNSSYDFSYDDYIAKILLGPIDPEMDQLNDQETLIERIFKNGNKPRKTKSRKTRKNN